jgi:Ca2+-binding EF-hand superfamily protein
MFDEKKDNLLDIFEFDKLILYAGQNLEESEVKEAFQVFDFNKNGTVTFQEFYDVLCNKRESNVINLKVMVDFQ